MKNGITDLLRSVMPFLCLTMFLYTPSRNFSLPAAMLVVSCKAEDRQGVDTAEP